MRTLSILASITIIFLVMFIPVGQAETPFEITGCKTGPAIMLSSSQELIIFSVELKGVIMSNHENKVFDNFATHFVGVAQAMAGKINALGYSKLIDPDGDFIFVESAQVGPIGGELTWKFLEGTGKWKGITGGGKSRIITKGKVIVEGTYRDCHRAIGTFELPKK